MPCPARAAEAALVLSDVARAHGETQRCLDLAHQALATAQQLGSPHLRTAAVRAIRRAGGRAPGESVPAAERDLVLSPRELEVVRLVAAGRSNQEIATQMGISVRTAAAHVSHVLTRLDLRNRAEIARWVGERGVSVLGGGA